MTLIPVLFLGRVLFAGPWDFIQDSGACPPEGFSGIRNLKNYRVSD